MPAPAFNPFNPWSYLSLWSSPRAVYPSQPRIAEGTPIEIKPRNSDPGLQIAKGPNSVTLRGTTEGPELVRYHDGDIKYEVARGVSFTLDIDRAPTVDVFGKENFTEKNSRIFTLDTSAGMSAAACARALADKVNDGDDFRAAVKTHRDGSATIDFRRL